MAARKFRKIIIQSLVIVGILGGFFGYRYIKGDPSPQAKEEIRAPVVATIPMEGALRKTLSLNGYMESKSMVTVLPMVSGLLTQLNVEVGSTVNEGQVIGRVDDNALQLQVKQAEAAYLSASSSYDRVSKLFEAGATSKQNYDQTKSQYDAYKSQYDLALLQAEYAAVKAPVSGVVLVRHTSTGSLVSPQIPIVTIGDLNDLRIRLDIPEKYYDTFTERENGMDITIARPDVPVESYTGQIETISPFINAETKTFEVTVYAEELSRKLRPGMYVRTAFVLAEQKNVLSLPFDALVSGNTVWFVDTETGTAHSTSLSVRFYNDEAFAVPDEFQGRQVIIEGQHFLREGQKVRVLNQEG